MTAPSTLPLRRLISTWRGSIERWIRWHRCSAQRRHIGVRSKGPERIERMATGPVRPADMSPRAWAAMWIREAKRILRGGVGL